MKDLLSKAKSLPTHKQNVSAKVPFTRAEVPLLIGYLNGEVSTRQYAFAIGVPNPGSITHRIAAALKQAVAKGWIEIKLHGK